MIERVKSRLDPKTQKITSTVDNHTLTDMPKSISQKILRNTSFNIFGKILHTAVYLVIIPFIIHSVGGTRYGIWVVLFAFVEYFNLLDLGFGAAVVKYTADNYACNNIARIGQIIITAFLFYLLLVPLIVAPIFFIDSIVVFFNVAHDNLEEAAFVFRGVLLIFAFNYITSVFRNVLIGLQRIDIQNLCDMVYTLLYAAGVVIVLKSGFGLKGLIILVGLLRIALVSVQTVCVFKIVPEIKQGLRYASGKIFRDFFKYGIKLQITSFAGLFNFQLDKILIGHFLRMEMVTFYDLGSKVAMFIRQAPAVLLSPLIPASAELAAMGDRERLEAMYIRGAKYITFIAAPIAAFLGTMAPTILLIWMGKGDYDYAVIALRILAVGYFFNIITGVITSMGRGIGVLHYELQTSCFVALANLFLSVFLIIKIGFIGALIGTMVAMTLGNILYVYRFNQYLKVPFTDFLKETFAKPVIVCFLTGAVIWSGQYLIFNNLISISINRINMAMYLILAGIFFTLIYSGCLSLIGFIKRSDLEIFQRAMRSIRGV